MPWNVSHVIPLVVNFQMKGQLPIACRYVPYDQWFITHIDATWKIKHLKQRIVSKCLNLPFDPRLIQKDISPNARSPSPITFAPDASMRPHSPIELALLGAGDGDQESTGGDEGYEQDDEWEQDFDVPSNVKVKPKSSSLSPSFQARQQRQKHKQEQEQQMTTHTYTLFRFSTGQVLEEDFHVSWYDIQPHELVELHSSFSPSTFTSSLLPITPPPPNIIGVDAPPQTKSTQKKKKSSSTTTTGQDLPPIQSAIVLPRHVPKLYIQPYWQGWVRALRVVWRLQMMSDEYPHPAVQDYLKGETGEGGERRGRRHGETVEWTERWVVIHNGVLNICSSPADPNPTRLPLSSLMALRGAEHFAEPVYTKNVTSKHSVSSKPSTSEPLTLTTAAVNSRTRSHTRPEDVPKQVGKSQEITGNDKQPTRDTRHLKKTRKDGKHLFSTSSSPSLRTGQDRQPHRTFSYTPAHTTSQSKPKLPLPFTAQERERHNALEIRNGKENAEIETESFEVNSRSDKDRDKTFIPTSREEAEQAGMRIVCAKFCLRPAAAREWDKVVEDIKQAGAFPKTRRYTSTGPSLALVAGLAPGGANIKTSTGPHVVIDSTASVGESSCEDVHGRHQPRPQPQGVLIGSSQTTLFSLSGATTATTASTGSATTSPILCHTTLTWNLFGGIQDDKLDDKERQTTETRRTAHDSHLSPSATGAEERWKTLPQKLEKEISRSTEFGGEGDEEVGGEGDEEGYAISNAEPSMAAIPTNFPEFQSEPQPLNEAHDSDSSSSMSVSSPVFAHCTHESDLDDGTYGLGAVSTASGVTGVGSISSPRKGYRYGGYHIQAQMKKGKGVGEDECLVGDNHGRVVGKAAAEEIGANWDVERKLGDHDRAQEARREEKWQEGDNEDKEREGWITLDMVNDHAFNSILRILHRHFPPPLSSSFTPSHTTSVPYQPNISNKLKLNLTEDLHRASEAPSDTDDDGPYPVTAKNSTRRNHAIHPPILESRTAACRFTQQPLYVALPYPEWRLEIVNRARRAGMREIGRPLDLALHGWGREFEEMAAAARERKLEMEMEMEREKKERRRSVQSHVSTIKQKERKVSRAVGGSDADDDADDDLGDDEEEAAGTTQLDSDSEEESDTEWFAWMTDLSRQFHVQQSQLAAQTSQQGSGSVFTNPFSTLIEDDTGPVRPPRTQEEERFLHANKIKKLEPSAVFTVLPPPTSNSFVDPPTFLSFESLNNQRGSSSCNSTSFPEFSPTKDLPVNKSSHSMSQSRSLQHLGSYRHVPEEGGDGYNPAAPLSSSRQGLYHSVSMDQHLSSKKNDSITSLQTLLERPILTKEQRKQIELETPPSWSLPADWTLPPMPMPSSPSRPLPSSLHTPLHTPSTSTSTTRTPVSLSSAPSNATGSTGGDVELKAAPLRSRLTSSDLGRWPSSVGVSTSLLMPPSPSASVAASPNSTSPPRSSVFGSLGRGPSLLGKMGVSTGQEKEKKGFLKKRMSRDLGKEKEKDQDASEGTTSSVAATWSPNQRPPKLLLPAFTSSASSSSTPHRNHPSLLHEIPFPTHNPGPSGHHPYHSPSAISSARALLRRVRSGSSLQGQGGSAAIPETEGKEVPKKKKGTLDRIVRGFDSSLAFAEGR